MLTETAHSAAGAVLGTIANTYDAMGRTLTRSAGGNTDSYTYAKGQVVTAVTGGTVEKTYGRNGNVLTYTLKDGTNTLADSASYEYDNALRLSAVTNYDATSGNALYTVSYTYDENGNRTAEESTAGTEVYYLYNDANLVRSMINYARDAWNDPVITEAYTYGYYTDGNQRMKTDAVSGKKTVYVYDAAGRLISETESVSGTVTQAYVYTYDASGNRLSLTATGSEAYSVVYTYDKANRLLTEARTENGTTETKTYTYDPNGNLLTVSVGGTVLESYTYDAFGKMVSYSKSGETTSYTYRPDGLLYTKQAGDETKMFIFSDGQMVYEQTGTDNIGAVIYSYGLTRIAAKSRESLAESQEIRYYYLYNAHGDVVRTIGSDRITVTTYDYDAFGNDRNTANALISDSNPFRYCGEYFDTATGTYFLRARWYDPSTGRFTQQDAWAYYNPNDPLSLNLYVYCGNNPVTRIDPMGTSWKDFFAGLVLAIDDALLNGFSQWINDGKTYEEQDSEDYYLGRTLGSAVCVVIGIVETANGVKTIIKSIEGGIALTATTAGTGSVVAVGVTVAGVTAGAVETGAGIAITLKSAQGFGKDLSDLSKALSKRNTIDLDSLDFPLTGKDADLAAKELGYSKTKYRSHGQPVYKKGNKYITPDIDRHNGGVWKMADSVENLASKSTRLGTYDIHLNRIGD